MRDVQICDNYAIAAAKTRDTLAAARAFVRTVELSKGGHVNLAVLAELVGAVEQAHGCSRGGAAGAHDGRKGATAGDDAHDASVSAGLNGTDEDAGDTDSQGVVGGGEDAARVLEALAAVTVGTSADVNNSEAGMRTALKRQTRRQQRACCGGVPCWCVTLCVVFSLSTTLHLRRDERLVQSHATTKLRCVTPSSEQVFVPK